MSVIILGDLIADISMRLPKFPVQAKDIHRLSYLEVGPGGACNIAIMAARYGLPVSCFGEVGDDNFGRFVRDGLLAEGADVSHLYVTVGASTPVAGVVVDERGEPAYLGYPGSLQLRSFPDMWTAPLAGAQALYADGWAENASVPKILLHAFEIARAASLPVFFDPGPGNPDVDSAWVPEAVSKTSVLMCNRAEAARLSGKESDEDMLAALLQRGPTTVILKRGKDGLLVGRGAERAEMPGFAVTAKDATGAGDSLSGAIIYATLNSWPLEKLAVLGNATGAAKVQKLGTGHNMPTMAEVAAVLQANGYAPADYVPDYV
jgi:sugar/nucleoside kinase (ribokinase family)